MAEYISREALLLRLNDIWLTAKPTDTMYDDDRQLAMVRCMGLNDAMDAVKSIPAADVVPMDFHERCLQIEIQKRMALEKADVRPVPMWTDEPISGTEFMTHNQGQSGFEIHFRTDDKAKYEAVQDECRRQIGHAKPAADVRPVVRGKWIYDHWCEFKCSNCGAWSKSEPYRGRENFCPNCGADMREES